MWRFERQSRFGVIRLSLVAIMLLLLTGCPLGEETGRIDSECFTVGKQCRLEEGGLGVCSMTLENELFCMSQH